MITIKGAHDLKGVIVFFLKELPTKEMLERMHERIPDLNVDTVDRALKMLRQASVLLREIENYFSKHNFSQLRFLILMVIYREDRPLLISEIISSIDVSKPVMTRTLTNLEGEKFIRMEKHHRDKRAKIVALTPEGENKLIQSLPGYYSLINRVMDE